MTAEIRVGILGCGKIANTDHIPGFLGLEGSRITALCDVNPGAIEATRAAFPALADATCFGDETEFMESGLIDAVAVCTPNDCHCPQTLAACRAGLHVLCDKPMAASLDEATAMIEAAHTAGVILQINHSLRFNAQYQAAVGLARDGSIGEPFHVRCIRACAKTPNESWSLGADWFVQKEHQGGLVLDIGIHMADFLRMIMGDVEKVAGLVDTRRSDINVPDNVNALFRHKNGGTGILELSWTAPGGAGFVEVYGTQGQIRMGFGDKAIELRKSDGDESVISFPEPAATRNSQYVFRDAIRGESPSLTPGEYGRRALAICLAIEESSRSGQFAAVEQFPDDEVMIPG